MQKIAFKNGFSLIRTAEVKEIDATLYELSHDKTGAELIYLEREEENKTFAIAFNTPPVDSTGVFHIIEHSVLCGSEKYPLKDPFAELLKEQCDIPIDFYDERMTTMVAHRFLSESGTFGKKRKGVVDTLSAEIILQNYLDRERLAGR